MIGVCGTFHRGNFLLGRAHQVYASWAKRPCALCRRNVPSRQCLFATRGFSLCGTSRAASSLSSGGRSFSPGVNAQQKISYPDRKGRFFLPRPSLARRPWSGGTPARRRICLATIQRWVPQVRCLNLGLGLVFILSDSAIREMLSAFEEPSPHFRAHGLWLTTYS